jgi:peptidoglycan/xylan/chitin deacetylase (PgdA/CDA1 family)
VLRLFEKYKMPVTWNVYTRALAKSPYWVKPLLESGGEVSLGGHLYRNNMDVPPEEEDRLIGVAIDTLQELTGDKTLPHGEQHKGRADPGWFSDRRSNLTVQLYAAEHAKRGLPLAYSSDSCSDDLPYWRPAPGGREDGLLMVPFSYDCSDIRFNSNGSGFASPRDYVEHLVRRAMSALTRRKTHLIVCGKKAKRASRK